VTIIIELGYDADGNALDYVNFSAFAAAWGVNPNLPLTLIEDVLINVWYSDASQSKFFDEQISLPAIERGDEYVIKFIGAYGHFYDETCPKIAQLVDNTNINNYTIIMLENLDMDETPSSLYDNYPIYTSYKQFAISAINCRFKGRDATRIQYNALSFWGCIFIGERTIVAGLNALSLYYSLAIGTNVDHITAMTGNINCVNSTIYTPYALLYNSRNIGFTENSIIYCQKTHHSLPDISRSNLKANSFNSSCVYQTDYPTKLFNDWSPEETYGLRTGYQFVESIIGDPLFVNTSGTFSEVADFALAEDSPCRYENRTIPDNALFPANKKELTTIGAWTYFISDLPIVEDVFAGTVYDDGRKVGTFNPYANATQVGIANIPSPATVMQGIPVEDTVGTLYVPLISEDDVRFGVQF
jgi:hypothetical protein